MKRSKYNYALPNSGILCVQRLEDENRHVYFVAKVHSVFYIIFKHYDALIFGAVEEAQQHVDDIARMRGLEHEELDWW